MKISARNILKGKVVKIVHGAVNSEVTIELPGGAQLVSIITNTSVDTLGLTEGKAGLCHHQGFQCHDRGRLILFYGEEYENIEAAQYQFFPSY